MATEAASPRRPNTKELRASSSITRRFGRWKPWLSHSPSTMLNSRGCADSVAGRSTSEPTTALSVDVSRYAATATPTTIGTAIARTSGSWTSASTTMRTTTGTARTPATMSNGDMAAVVDEADELRAPSRAPVTAATIRTAP